jgi:hypothetical protein
MKLTKKEKEYFDFLVKGGFGSDEAMLKIKRNREQGAKPLWFEKKSIGEKVDMLKAYAKERNQPLPLKAFIGTCSTCDLKCNGRQQRGYCEITLLSDGTFKQDCYIIGE